LDTCIYIVISTSHVTSLIDTTQSMKSRDLTISECRGQNPSNEWIKRIYCSITKYGYYI